MVGVACGPEGGADGIGEAFFGLPPATHGATLVSHNMPLAVNPGERLNVRFTMLNNGASSPTDDWPTSYFFRSTTSPINRWGFTVVAVPAPTPVGSSANFDFVVTAPSATNPNDSVSARMYVGGVGGGYFGDNVVVSGIDVNPANQRRWDCSLVSHNMPGHIPTGAIRSVTITVQNAGTQAWGTGGQGYCLNSRNSPINLWGNTTCPGAGVGVAPGGTVSYTFNVTAPTTPGTYPFRWQMRTPNPPNGVGVIDLINNCLDTSVIAETPTTDYDALVVSQNFPTQMAPGEIRQVAVRMRNTGSASWPANGDIYFHSQTTPVNLWGVVLAPTTQIVPSLSEFTYNLTIRAPATPGNYNHIWRMRKVNNPSAGFFGEQINLPVVVSGTVTPQYDAAVVSQTIPSQIAPPNSLQTFRITMQNTGTNAWVGSSFRLFSQNSPSNLWGLVESPLGASETVAPGATREFVLLVRAPATPGLYASAWRMRQNGGVGNFGQTATTPSIEVSWCGDGTTQSAFGETCDDGNRISGDGCSSSCTVESTSIDLLTNAGRTITGSRNLGQMGNVAIADMNADGTRDVIVGELAGRATPTLRANGGEVFVYTGGASFLNGSTTTATRAASGGYLVIYGAEANDEFGGGIDGTIVVGEVTGDSAADAVISAPGADGTSNGRADAGEIFVVRAHPNLATLGSVDLATAPLGVYVRSRIIGPVAGGRARVLAVGDADGDGVGDILIGVPLADPLGRTDAGEAYLIRGGATLPTTLDLSAGLANPAVLAIFRGVAADDRLGRSGAIGNFGGPSTTGDVVVGAELFDPAGRDHAGGAWGVFGPAAGDFDLAAGAGNPGGADVEWFGGDLFGQLGASVAIGDVTGDAVGDVALGGSQLLNPSAVAPDSQRGGVLVYGGGAGLVGTIDVGTTPADHAIYGFEFGDTFGSRLVLGDANGDSALDLIVTAPNADGAGNARSGSGEVNVVLGGAGLPAMLDLATTGPALLLYGPRAVGLAGRFPSNIAVGRIDSDSKVDICVGSSNGDSGRVDCVRSTF
ncbi:MAG: hypothetical protein IT384_20080 [Deltaproteobacteria bacterium]|nr:hypothetical protein [Deltaproteobacteria bacterium]